MKLIKRWLTLALVAAASVACLGAFRKTVPVGALQQSADIIAIATLTEINIASNPMTLKLQVVTVLQGQPTSTSLAVTPPQGAVGLPPASLVGTTGVWFLKRAPGGYVVLPLVAGIYTLGEAFIPMQAASVGSSATGTLGQQLLNYELQWYQSLPSPSSDEDERLFASLIYHNGNDAWNAISALASATVLSQHIVGLAAQLRLGSPDAISRVVSELDMLKSNPRFPYVLMSLTSYSALQNSALQNSAAVAALTNLVSLQSGVPGIDSAASIALLNIGNGAHLLRSSLPAKIVLPPLALLLDSKDSAAQMRAVRFFAYFAMFADATGNIPGTGITGPFASQDTRQYTPANASTLTPAQYAGYWKVWWAQNQAALGY